VLRLISISLLLGLRVLAADLPDPLVMADGTPVTNAAQWREKRRPELLELFTREMYGRSPGKPPKFVSEVFDRDTQALGGKATRLQIALYPAGKPGLRMDLLIYVPNATKQPSPVILGLNFSGNQAIHPDPGIRLTESWVDDKSAKDHRATDASRGTNAKQWPVEEILSRGYALATMYREDVCPDHLPYFESGVQPLFPELQQGEDNFGCIAAWAWSLSRSLDVMENEPLLDSKRVAVFGFSRLGKAALWAGAVDERFAMVISNESGAGGAKLFHRGMGEDIARLNTNFPHWFARNFRKYIGKDKELPFDQHQVISLVAPRPIYVASAEDDKHSDPEGEFASLQAANPVFKLLGSGGLPAAIFPAVNSSLQGDNGYHIRTGRHDVTDFDWQQYLDFADRRLKKQEK
jgi:hypothetical protein